MRAITYMMGNNVIVETMFRHDAGVMLYAPLRTAIYEDNTGRVHFSIDQPSTKFASFGDPRISEVGLQLDVKLAALLHLLESADSRRTRTDLTQRDPDRFEEDHHERQPDPCPVLDRPISAQH